ncbi:MAG: protein-export chaperone SecB [Gammaproteobacteria bacterium]
MAEANSTETVASPGQGQFSLEHIYLKDCSFESPLAPGVFMEQFDPPEASIGIQTQVNGLESRPEAREVVLSVTVEAKSQERSIFICEVHVAALVSIGEISEADLGRVVGARVPEVLFPYVRQTISDLVVRGGFLPVMLQPIDFDAIYEQHANASGMTLNS